ncbi:MAG: YciI family protein [Fimbriimonadaceae bacterium]
MITALVGMAMAMQDVKMPPMETYTLLIFKSGTRPEGITQEAVEKMQAEHLANLGRLFDEKKAPCAGPFDKGGDFRGIVILTLPKDKVAAEFDADPFVKNGLLKIELYPWMAPKDMFTWDWKEDTKMMRGTLAWVKEGPHFGELKGEEFDKAMARHINHNLDLMRNGDAGLIGPASEKNELGRGFYLFLTDEDEKIKAFNDQDPLLKSGHFMMESKKLWFGSGLFKKLAK